MNHVSASSLTRVLYVEDDPDIQAIVRIALETVGQLQLRICSSGQEAVDAVGEFRPDFLLLDVMMPGLDGPQTLEQIRSIDGFADVPAAFCTAKVQPQEIERLRALGACDVIAKPFDPLSLAAQLRSLYAEATR
ncbi:response regulator [Roseiterribacter gracilis]|uniref:Response regulator n=1 Tax=Roseiterribacter gracilis TaxID=2812848 RepID=A0A8S8XAX4_9PROT|nr:response regulator [Rhodospirillales bacterium TMPK1]